MAGSSVSISIVFGSVDTLSVIVGEGERVIDLSEGVLELGTASRSTVSLLCDCFEFILLFILSNALRKRCVVEFLVFA